MKKSLVAIGGSIVKGTYTGENDKSPMSIAHPNFAEIVCKELGFDELLNYGQNGVCLSPFKGPFPKDATLRKFDFAEAGDALIIMGGSNDYAASIPIGKPTDRTESTFMGSIRLLFEKVAKIYPKEKVCVVNSIRRHVDGENEVGATLADYRAAFCRLISEFGFIEVSGPDIPMDPHDPEHREKYLRDGLHPNVEGHRILADVIISKVKDTF